MFRPPSVHPRPPHLTGLLPRRLRRLAPLRRAARVATHTVAHLTTVALLLSVPTAVYYATAGGDPAQVDKAKGAFKNALIGYALAVLAPVLLEVVKGIVGG